MSMYNLLEYSDSYEDYSGSLYQFKRVEQNVGDNGILIMLIQMLHHLLNTKQVF